MRNKRFIATMTMAAVISASVFAACSDPKEASDQTEETVAATAAETEASSETSETEAPKTGKRDGKLVDPATVELTNLSTSDTPDLYTQGEPADDFIPSEDYGMIIPYFTERDLNVGSNYSYDMTFGFASEDGTMICNPVFDYFWLNKDIPGTDSKPYLFYMVGKGLSCGIINGSGTYYSGCNFHRVYDVDNGYQKLVVLARYEGDYIYNTVYDIVNDKVLFEDIKYPVSYHPYGFVESDVKLYTLRYVIDEEHIILECNSDSYIYYVNEDRLFPDPNVVEDDMSDGEIVIGYVTHKVVPMADDTFLVQERPGKCYLMDINGKALTPVFYSFHDMWCISDSEGKNPDWPRKFEYAFFTTKENPEEAVVYNTKGEYITTFPMVEYDLALWLPEDEYYISMPNGDQVKFDSELQPMDESVQHVPGYLWKVISGDVTCMNMLYDTGYCNYESACYAFDINPATANKDEVLAKYDGFEGCHFYVHDNGELIFKSNSMANDVFTDQVTGKHYITFTEGTDEVSGSSLIELSEAPNDFSSAIIANPPDNMIYCLEDKQIINLGTFSPLSKVLAVRDDHLILRNYIGGMDEATGGTIYPFPVDKKAYTEVYDISDPENPKMVFHYTATDCG